MGILFLFSKKSTKCILIYSVDDVPQFKYITKYNDYILMQGLALSIEELYKKIGDLNLNPSNHDQVQKLETLKS